MAIECSDGINIEIDLEESAWERVHWSFVASYDSDSNGLHYYGSRMESHYLEETDEFQDSYSYTDGEGLLFIGDDGMLYWDNYIEYTSHNYYFEKI